MKSKTVIIGYASALLASVLFGAVPTMAKPIVSNMNILLLSSLVYLIATLTFTPIAQRTKTSCTRKDYGILIIIGVCGATIAPLLYFLGLNQSTASDTAFIKC